MSNSENLAAIPSRLKNVRQRINDALKMAPNSQDVTLVAVSKRHTPESIRAAYACGQRDFGENYLQEALDKISALKLNDICWHFIGPIQSNKTRAISENFSWVHTVDRLKVAQRLSNQRPEHLPPLNVCIQVNIDNEESKAGVLAKQCAQLVEEVSQLPRLCVRGLMAIPAKAKPEDEQSAFKRMQRLYSSMAEQQGNHWDTLSMGMSADLEAAIANGANVVRIGTDIFGPRDAY